ncbi:polysaccharide biosynthesis/export family protein [Erythrobacter sp. GH1-10]|uniref:polysaccharide biosynthesis/export family protein n=1 Tax=Erythrobacter sp. GH1-10 TaxID=3349334 RepID=UPI0038782E25
MSFRVFAIALLLLSGCATGSPRVGGDPSITLIQEGALPTPVSKLGDQGEPTYVLGARDILIVDVFGIEFLTEREFAIDDGGRLSIPLAGPVIAAGLSPTELESLVRARLMENNVRDPRVTINVKEAVSQIFTVEGEVEEPGMYSVAGQMTLLRAIAKANGTGEFAKLQEVVVFREIDGQRYAALYDLKAIRAGNYADPNIYANDVVVVGDSNARRLFKDFLQILPLVTTPIVIAFQR